MKRFLYASSILLLVLSVFFATPLSARASEGDGDGEHGLEVEVNGYHVTLDSQNEWAQGENLLVVTITDSMGMPLSDADVEILVAPMDGGHEESETAAHDEGQDDAMSGMETEADHAEESPTPGMDMGDEHSEEPEPGVMKPVAEESHDEEMGSPIAMTEAEHGTYTVQTHLESSGEHDVHVYFHVNGEMLQADFVVKVTGSNSKYAVIWSFAAINAAVVAAAGVMKKQK